MTPPSPAPPPIRSVVVTIWPGTLPAAARTPEGSRVEALSVTVAWRGGKPVAVLELPCVIELGAGGAE